MSEDTTRDFGAYLREARERAGVTLRTIATSTKISVFALEALERNDLGRLPGGIFVRAFVRAYAKEVGLDPEDAVRRFVARFPDTAVEENPIPYEANPEKIVVDGEQAAGRLWRIVGWSLPIVAVIVYFGFGGRLSFWNGQQPLPATRADQPAEQPPAPAAVPVLTTPAQVARPEGATPSGPGTAESTNGSPAAAPRSADKPSPEADQASAVPAEPHFQVTLTARGRCWVTVRSNGRIVFTGTMNASERKELQLTGNVSLTLGNAGLMDVAIDGQPARPLGAEGQVVTALMNVRNLKTFFEPR